MKKFLVKDKTGRGFAATLTGKEVKKYFSGKDYQGIKVKHFVKDSEVGEVWENAEMRITRQK